MKVRPAICIVENQQILLMRYEYNGAAVYNLPGGNPDPNETIPETIKRELFEELGIEVVTEKIIALGEMSLPNGKEDVLHIIFSGKITGDNFAILNPKETSAKEVLWKNIEDLQHINMYPNIGKELLERIKNSDLDNYIGKINQVWF